MDKERNNFRIIAFANAFWMSNRGLGGGDRRAIAIFKRFLAKGIEVKIVASKMGYNNYKEYIDLNYIIVPFSITDKLGLLVSYFVRTIIACGLKLDLREKDVLYSTSDFLPDVLPALAHKFRNKNVRWVQIIHHLIPHPSKRTGPVITNIISYYAQIISFFFIKRFSDLVLVVNPSMEKKLTELGFDSSKVRLSSNGIDVNYLKNVEANEKIRYQGVFLGRLHPSKGIFDLIEIWKLVCEKKSYAKLRFIGGGNEKIKKLLIKKIKENDLENNIDVLGYLEGDEAFGIVKSSKVFISPSYEEGFGISICEAMALGLPVVAWNLPVYEHIFPKGMIRVPLDDVKGFAAEIVELLSNKQLYEHMKKDATNVALKYDWGKITEKELKMLGSLV